MNRARTLRLSVSLLLALVAATLGGWSVYRKVQTFQPLGFEALPASNLSPVAQMIQVDRVADAQTGLQPGDEILLVQGGEVGGPTALAERLRERPASRLTVLRGTGMVEVDYHRPALRIDFPYLIVALIGGLYLLIGLYTLLRKTDRQGFLFCLWALISAAFYLLSPVPPVDAGYVIVFLGDEIARLLLPALTLHLFLVFPTPLRLAGSDEPAPWLRRLIPFLYLPAAVFFALQLQQIRSPHVARATVALLDRLEMVHLAVCALAAVTLL
ncbi:MAG TPA: hypothetical protein VGK45_15930, partial [Thermoanaerobaculia bacterium]